MKSNNILLIDDEELVTSSLKLLLRKEGFNVTVVKSGIEALRIIQEEDFNLIISDVKMPGMDGLETIKRIRAHLKNTNRKLIKEILITGYADIEKYNEGIKLKVTDYLYKPFDNEEFLNTIKRTLNTSKLIE